MKFAELNITPPILRALKEEGYKEATPIQESIPMVLEGNDLLGCAQTGTGKTAAFAVPILQRLDDFEGVGKRNSPIRALVITPTRELASQIYDSFRTYGKYTRLRSCVIFGGVSQKPQAEKLKKGVDILIATPGRLKDLVNQRIVNIKHIEMFVLDEADRMLDMGFVHDVKKIITMIPEDKQTLLFSATMPPEVEQIANKLLHNPIKVEVTPESSTVDRIEQYLYYVDKANKKNLLLHLLKDDKIKNVLVFTRTKHGANKVVDQLVKANIKATAIHGDKSQGARQRALKSFKDGLVRVLVATDIAARGIDIDELSHVINFDLPEVPEAYVHRIGRTGRAGREGIAIAFCDFDEKPLMAEIEKTIGKEVEVIDDHPFPLLNNFPREKKTRLRVKRTQPSENKRHSQDNQKSSGDKSRKSSENKRYAADRKRKSNEEKRYSGDRKRKSNNKDRSK
ncbi:MAG: DEAD/DEAH box helicase [Anaerovoracaceae bacterium]